MSLNGNLNYLALSTPNQGGTLTWISNTSPIKPDAINKMYREGSKLSPPKTIRKKASNPPTCT